MRVLIIGDTHCPGMLPGYPSFLQRVYREWNCDTVVMIGDLIDWAAISYHETNPELPAPADELKAARRQIARLTKVFPEAHWLQGNHDCLPERKVRTAGVPPSMLNDIRSVVGVPDTWKVYPRFSAVRLDKVVYKHGDAGKAGMFAAVKNSRDNFCNWVQGHCHSEAGVWWTQTETGRVFGMNVGCGIDRKRLQFRYGRKFNKKPVIGCGVVIDGKYPFFVPF